MKIRTEVHLFVFLWEKIYAWPSAFKRFTRFTRDLLHLLARCVNNGLKFSYHHDPSRWRRGSGLDSWSGDQRSIPGVPQHHARPPTAMKLKTSSDVQVPVWWCLALPPPLIISKSSTWTTYLELVFKLRKSSSTRIYHAQKIDMGYGNCIVCR